MKRIAKYYGDMNVDLHVHPRPNCFEKEVLLQYARILHAKNHVAIGMLEHGIRFSSSHKGILLTQEDINSFISVCKDVAIKVSIEILVGIEVDYICDEVNQKEYYDYLNMVEKSELDYIVGSVHGYSGKRNKEYMLATLDMVTNYPITVLGHFHIWDEDELDVNLFERILSVMSTRGIAFEINSAPRYKMSKALTDIIYKCINLYEVPVVYGSDAHDIIELKILQDSNISDQ